MATAVLTSRGFIDRSGSNNVHNIFGKGWQDLGTLFLLLYLAATFNQSLSPPIYEGCGGPDDLYIKEMRGKQFFFSSNTTDLWILPLHDPE